MQTAITKGIKISVEVFYQRKFSRPARNEYIFAYLITIENNSEYTVQLMRRHWFITDSISLKREVEGEGIVGEQPILKPGEQHQYTSACPLKSEIGTMEGTYLMRKSVDNEEFKVKIPLFSLVAPFKLN